VHRISAAPQAAYDPHTSIKSSFYFDTLKLQFIRIEESSDQAYRIELEQLFRFAAAWTVRVFEQQLLEFIDENSGASEPGLRKRQRNLAERTQIFPMISASAAAWSIWDAPYTGLY
jgi:hypothetical protein